MQKKLSNISLISSRSLSLVLLFSIVLSITGQDRVYFGNLHSHTSYSDGRGTPREAYTHARDIAKIDFLALTEHNHSKAMGSDGIGIAANASLYDGGPNSLLKTAVAMTENGRFVALYGQEFSVIKIGNHANVFEISKVITAANGRFDQLATFLNANPDSAGKPPIIMFNHPKNTSTIQNQEYGLDDFGGNQEEWIRKLGPHAALIQMINGPGQKAGVGLKAARPAESAFKKFLSLGFKLAPTADQDNHTENWGNSTNARTAVISTSLTRESVLEALRARHVYATEDRNLKIVIKVNGRLCGDIIPVPAAGEANITFSIQDADEPNAQYEIEVWRGAVGNEKPKMVNAITTAGGNGQIEDIALSGSPEFFFFKIIQTDSGDDEDDDEDEAWTAPVWFENLVQPLSPLTLPAINSLIASRKSKIYHVSTECLDAKRIRSANRISGTEARKGRVVHEDCPRRPRN